jgi:hypothetical protein
MPTSDGVLAAIDACLDDYAVSEDAMRWAPDEPDTTPAAGEWRGFEPNYAIFDECIQVDPARLAAAFAPLVNLRLDVSGFAEVIENTRRAVEGFGRAYFNGWIAPSTYMLAGAPKRRQAVNAAYARRRRARARRRR